MIQLLAAIVLGESSVHKPDTAPLEDPERMVTEITRTSFSLQYATSTPCETRVEFREGGRFAAVAHATPTYRTTDPGAGLTLWHTIDITGLKPGKRYYYRILDPSVNPTGTEAEWGAAPPWSREYAVSTEASAGRKTIIRLPVKVLLMPNVVNAESAVQPDGSTAPDPPKITPAQLKLIEDEYEVASRFYWANSGMRLWVDFQFVVDDRWQRWGPPAAGASAFFENLPPCRSYGGEDFIQPGGGVVTFVDIRNPSHESTTPIDDGFACQIEQAWPRRWDPVLRVWKFYTSGGNTLGAEQLPLGVAARSQFLAGSDTAWLAADEFHHQLESLGALCLGNTEDDRIVPDKPAPRHKILRGDGSLVEQAWTTTGPHGEFWDDLRYWDKQISDCQWLRFGFGSTETVVDKDGDGFPDNDARLPMDAKRFRQFVPQFSTFEAACNFDFAWLPIQPSWTKEWDDAKPVQSNGISGTSSVAPVESRRVGANTELSIGRKPELPPGITPKLVQFHAPLDADLAKWNSISNFGTIIHDMNVTYKQGYDDAGYYGLVVAKGPLGHIDIDLDGAGMGMYTPPGAIGFTVTSLKPAAGQAGPMVLPVSVKPTFGAVRGEIPGLTWKASRSADGTLVFEFKIANGGDSPWYWQGAGQKIGVSINAYDLDGHGYSMGEPYRLYYSRMAESFGRGPRPAAPTTLGSTENVVNQSDPKSFAQRVGFALENDVYHSEPGTPGYLLVSGLKANEVEMTASIEGHGDFAIGECSDQTLKPSPEGNYSLVIQDGMASLYVYGVANDSERIHLGPGPHQYQVIRRMGGVWALIDGKVCGYSHDPTPNVVVTKLGIASTAHAEITLRSLTYRVMRNP